MVKSRSERGQAVVEFALVLPVVLIFVLFVIQVGLVVRDQIALVHACGSAARAASISSQPNSAAAELFARIPSLSEAALQISTSDKYVTIRVSSLSKTDLPLIGALTPDISIHAEATYRLQD